MNRHTLGIVQNSRAGTFTVHDVTEISVPVKEVDGVAYLYKRIKYDQLVKMAKELK
jgi:hypothetical protein